MEIKKRYIPDNNQGHWMIYKNGVFVCSCDDAELDSTLREIEGR